MTLWSRFVDVVRGAAGGRDNRPANRGWRPDLEALEDRAVPSTVSSITSNFNGTAIPAGDTLWFSAVFKPSGLGTSPVTLHVTDQTISFSAAGTNYVLPVPDADITFTPGLTLATTTFDAGANAWETSLPSHFSGNGFLAGLSVPVTAPLPGGINPVTWQASFSTDTGGMSLNWQWATAVYRPGFGFDYNSLGVKPLDANTGTAYANSDHAGTPENFKGLVTGGARGGGGSNFTGSLSPTRTVIPSTEVPPPPASISGFVLFDTNMDGMIDTGDTGFGGVVVTLTGTDNLGHTVTETAVTDATTGFYQFTNLLPGTYALSGSLVNGYDYGQAAVGTVNGNPDGTAQNPDLLNNIGLNAGDVGFDYDFLLVLPSGQT
jgi:hypothetical protein